MPSTGRKLELKAKTSVAQTALQAAVYAKGLAHTVYEMWIIQEPNKVALWNKRNFEEKRTEIMQHV
jgi:hypothetical protein